MSVSLIFLVSTYIFVIELFFYFCMSLSRFKWGLEGNVDQRRLNALTGGDDRPYTTANMVEKSHNWRDVSASSTKRLRQKKVSLFISLKYCCKRT